MQDSSLKNSVRSFLDADRGVSPVIAVALLILIAIGFAVAIQGAGASIIDSVQQPPEADINGNPGEDQLRLTIRSVTNADQLKVQIDGEEIHTWDDPRAGKTHNFVKDDLTEWNDDSRQITVVAINFPDDERVVYTYRIPQ